MTDGILRGPNTASIEVGNMGLVEDVQRLFQQAERVVCATDGDR